MSTIRDIYQEVTDRIVSALERGTVPWRRPWNAEAGQPRNAFDNRPYNGVNALLLGLSEYGDPRWATFKAIKAHGGHVRKGERSALVVFFKPLEVEDPDAPNGKRTVPLLRYFRVFNVEQTEGLDLPPLGETRDVPGIDAADSVLAGYRDAPTVTHGGSRACYSRVEDHVRMPAHDTFESSEAYYLTLWHELAHSTGHEARLARRDLADFERFGDASYSREELCAEIASSMVAARVGVVEPDIEQSAAYVAGWLRALRDDRRMIVSAASRAQKAADWILGS
jgi:antirestriction protein ArdC